MSLRVRLALVLAVAVLVPIVALQVSGWRRGHLSPARMHRR